MASPKNLSAVNLPNEPVEGAEPLILPVKPNPLLKLPLIRDAICADPLRTPGYKAPCKDVASPLPLVKFNKPTLNAFENSVHLYEATEVATD